jgi:phosphoribosylglycinamide formyltransferase 1
MKERLAILISGTGTTMAEIIKAQQSSILNLEIACIVSNDSNAPGLILAQQLGISKQDIIVIPQKPKENFSQRLLQELKNHNSTLVGQHGWLPLTPEIVINSFPNRIFNQHPGNPHLFGGKGMWGATVHQAALDFYLQTGKEENTWMTIQKVAPIFDEGEILSVLPVQIKKIDSVSSLKERCLPVEHQNTVEFYQKLLSKTLHPVKLTNINDLNQEEFDILNTCKQYAISLNLNEK